MSLGGVGHVELTEGYFGLIGKSILCIFYKHHFFVYIKENCFNNKGEYKTSEIAFIEPIVC